MVSYPQNSIVDPVSAVRENQVVESSVENEEKKPKENKRGKLQKAEEDLSGFKPQEVITQAHESLTSAMASYGQKNTRDALALFEKHVMDFERKGIDLTLACFQCRAVLFWWEQALFSM